MRTFLCLTLVVVEAILAAPVTALAIKRAEIVERSAAPEDSLPSWVYVGTKDQETPKIKRADDSEKVPDWTYVNADAEETPKMKREETVPDWIYVGHGTSVATKVKREETVPDWTYIHSSEDQTAKRDVGTGMA
ncbi:hypothetical protein MMC34_000296 [Xylographa carneopallida]|nr:hypothetical protein [Xylographa carneopallida]